MKQEIIFQLFIFISALIFQGCKQEYAPPAMQKNPGFLVVDGFLDNGGDTTFIKLTRTKPVQERPWNAAELNATMTIEDEQGNDAYSLQQLNSDGFYFVNALNLDLNKKYKLRINTVDGRQYLTDAITVKKTPPIDSLNWKRTDEGIQIYANTHDPSAKAKYYRWDYTETWEYHSYYYTPLKYENGAILHRKLPEEQVGECWTTENSTDLLLATSLKLSQDVIHMQPIRLIPNHSIEIGVKYSILLRQYALTDTAYSYLQHMRKITELTGSFFDPIPGEVGGNIHCITNSEELVIGFVTASSLETKRIFIEKVEVLPWNYRMYCDGLITVSEPFYEELLGGFREYTPIQEVYSNTGAIIAVLAASSLCTDCTTRGGSNVKPDFWP